MVGIFSTIGLILAITGNLLINHKNRLGYIVWIVSNVFWITVNILNAEPNIQQIIMFSIYTALNIHGLVKWGTKNEKT